MLAKLPPLEVNANKPPMQRLCHCHQISEDSAGTPPVTPDPPASPATASILDSPTLVAG